VVPPTTATAAAAEPAAAAATAATAAAPAAYRPVDHAEQYFATVPALSRGGRIAVAKVYGQKQRV